MDRKKNDRLRTSSFNQKAATLAPLGLAILLLLLFSLGLASLPGGTSKVTAALRGGGPIQGISEQAARQMSGLIQEKLSWTPAQRKIDSQIIFEIKKQKGLPIADGVPTLETGIELDKQGRLLVDIKASSAKLVEPVLGKLGAEVTSLFAKDVRARVPLSAIEELAATPEVIHIMPAAKYMTNVTNVSEGDTTHGAVLARSIFPSANGMGVRVGVLSDGVNSLAAVQGTGDLPAVTVLPGQAGSGDEGTAMLEIVHDLAPNAQLFFATAGPDILQFAQNIRDLRTAGCDIIIDDVTYFVETPFQNGQAPSVTAPTNGGAVIEAVNAVTAAGALYFSSAGNSGNLDDGTAGVWEGDFVDGGAAPPPIGPGAGNLHNFGAQTFDVLTASTRVVNLKWSDPLGGSSNDYDLYLLNSTGAAIIASSLNVQSGTQDPFEQIFSAGGFASNSRLVIVRFSGADRFLHLNTNRGRLSIATSGVTFGHNACANGYSVAAVPAHNPFAPGNPAGPFPGLFTSTQLSELFTSDGPRRIFFNADSSAITPGNFSSTGGALLMKPDITAADGVMCAAPGFNPFFGTSAAAPHAGAIAALIKSFNPALTPAQIRTILTSTAIDIEGAGWDRDTGVGIVMANQALTSLCTITCPANITRPNDPNQCGAVVTYPAPTTSGGSCGTVTCSPASGAVFPVGATVVTCTTAAGPSCTFTITVQDTQPPSITCPANITKSNDPDQCGAVTTYPAPTITDNCPGMFTATCVPPSGSFFPVGTTTVTCTVDGFRGGTAPALVTAVPDAITFKVGSNKTAGIIKGATPQKEAGKGSSGQRGGVNSPAAVLYSQTGAATNGSPSQNFETAFDTFDCQSADDFVVPAGQIWNVTQVNVGGTFSTGGPATSVNVTFYNNSGTLPGPTAVASFANVATFTLAPNFNITLPSAAVLPPGTYWVSVQVNMDFTTGGQWFWSNFGTTNIFSEYAWRNPGGGFGTPCASFGAGSTGCGVGGGVNRNSVFDIIGTISMSGGPNCTFTVTVQDTQPPVITCPPNQTAVTDQNACPAPACTVVNYPAPVATDNCGGTGVLYGASRSGQLFTINLSTAGAGTFVGNLPNSSTEIEFDNLTGRAFTQFPDGLFVGQEFDINTGAGIGAPVPNGGSYTGLEWVGSTLYGTVIFGPGGPSQLRTLNPFTGVSALIGATGIGPIAGLAFNQTTNVMYGITGGAEGGSSSLVTVNLATGAASLIGSVGFNAGSLEFGPDGNLYAGATSGSSNGSLFRINPATGASTLVGPTGFTNVTGLTLAQAGVNVVCSPPSGSCFPTGVTTVTCTATDPSGNTASCSFTVTTFDTAIEDDSNPAIILLWNSITGQYRFCCNGITFAGIGKASRQGCVYTLETPNASDRRILGRVDKAVHAGSGAIQAPPGATRCTITDRFTLNDPLMPACQ